MPSVPTAKNPNAPTAMASSTVVATPRVPLPAISSPAPRSVLRITTGTITTFSAADRAASR
jgi:hypothetical protein